LPDSAAIAPPSTGRWTSARRGTPTILADAVMHHGGRGAAAGDERRRGCRCPARKPPVVLDTDIIADPERSPAPRWSRRWSTTW
jgi:hypothetical protein